MFYKGSSITSHIADKLATEAALGECPSTITVQKASETDSVKESSETTGTRQRQAQLQSSRKSKVATIIIQRNIRHLVPILQFPVVVLNSDISVLV